MTSRKRLAVWLLLVLALAAFAPARALAQCGVERWSVKTGTDADVGLINLNMTMPIAITGLTSLPKPSTLPANNRIQPTEITQYVINATLTEFKLESDSDYHLVISDSAGNTMISEIPSPSCVGSGSPFLPGITNARAQMDAMYTVTTSFTTVNEPVTITGIGFFDFLHGQTGVAPNGVEIHPVLNITFGGGGSPSFSMSASPTSVNVVQGSSGTSTITTAVSGGFNSAISLSASGMPSGVTASFNPSSIAAPGAGTSTLTFSTTSTAATGTFPITITGTGGGMTHTATVNLTVSPGTSPSFSLSVSPSSLTFAQGASGTATATTTVAGGFNSAISLSASGMPSGVSANFNPSSIGAPGAGSSTLTLSATSSTTTGTYPVTITGSGGGLTRTASLSLTITSGTTPSFSLSVAPAALTVVQGSSGTATATTSVAGGFNSSISLSASGLPAGVTASFNPSSIPAPGAGSSTLTLSASSSAALGTSTITITGTGGGLTHTASMSLTINPSGGGSQLIVDGGFESATTSGLNAPGWTGTTNITGDNVIIFGGSHAHTGNNYASLGGNNNQADTLTQTISVPAGVTSAPLTFWVSIYTQETGTTAYDFLYVEIHNSSGALLATPLTLNNANSSSDGNTLGVYFQPASVDLTPYAGQTIEVVFHATTDFTLTTTFLIDDVSAMTNGGGTPSFTISASPSSVTIKQGASGASTISTSVSGGFNSAISLSASGLPSGASVSFNPSSIGAPGSGSSTMTISVGSTTPTGTYTITVTGSGGGLTKSTSVSLTVSSGTTPNFTISASPTSLTVGQGSSGTSTISTSVSGGFNSSIALSASGLPSGATASFNPSSIAAPGSGSSTMKISVGSSTAVGTYTVTVTGSGGGITHTAAVSLTVTSGSTQLIVDGGFESATANGNSAPGWTGTTNISGHYVIAYHGSYPHSGSNYGYEGAYNSDKDTLTQTLTIPSGITSAMLTFWVNVVTSETTTTTKYDYLYVEIHNSSGTLLSTPLTLSNLNSTSSGNTSGVYFQSAAINLASYAGQSIQLVFHVTTDSSLTTTFRIDDVSLLVH